MGVKEGLEALLALQGDAIGRPWLSTVVVLGLAEAGFAGGGGSSLGERRGFGGVRGIGIGIGIKIFVGGWWVLKEEFLEERGKRRGGRRRVWGLMVLEDGFWGRRTW